MENIRLRIAVLVGQADEGYQKQFIEGFLKRAFQFNCDACIFSMYKKYQDTEEREAGDSNIFNLVNYELFDAVVILKDSIQTTDMAEKLEKELHEHYKKTVVVIERESEYFDSIISDGYAPVYNLVSHLIEKHGFRDIAFLSGKRWHSHAKQRLLAYEDAMKMHNLPVLEHRIYYGDFWYLSGEECADRMLEGSEGLPEAVVCANDCMAIGLCDALSKKGIRVPEDIAVVGYDSMDEGKLSPKTITSANVPAKECGSYTVDYILAKEKGEEIKPFSTSAQMLIGESCGCKNEVDIAGLVKRRSWGTELSEEGYLSVNNSMEDDLLSQESLMDYLNTVYNYAYQIKNAKSFYLVLNSEWKSMDKDYSIKTLNDGYSEKLLCAIRYNSNGLGNYVGIDESFDRNDMIPELFSEREEASAYFFTPMFYEDTCFGYSVLSYGNEPVCYDEVYRLWMRSVARAFECLRRSLAVKLLLVNQERVKKTKFEIATENAGRRLTMEDQKLISTVEDILDYNQLTYHFQPIVNTKDGEIYSYEALMRSTSEVSVSPLDIIKYANIAGRLTDVERATFFNVLEVVDKNEEIFTGKKVFINSIPGVKLSDDEVFKIRELFERHNDIVVVELTEEAELKDSDLANIKALLSEIGVETAIDDYGTGYSNVSNLLRYMPNYVKIDRSLLSEIHIKPQKQHFVREIIEFCHDNNILALAEGVETSEELQMVIRLGADLIQGYYTARPAETIVPAIDEKIRAEIKAFYQEYLDGIAKQIYRTGKTNRVSINNLLKDGVTDILVGETNAVYRDIAIIGMPKLETGIHMRIESGYMGRITLDNVFFSNIKNRPCIELAEDCDVTLVLRGENYLKGGGILVPKGAKLTVEGEGNLSIKVNCEDFYGIGNDYYSSHGDLILSQDGIIKIEANGTNGCCIGSGEGGYIEINRGHYILNVTGDCGVGIGNINSDFDIKIRNCLIELESNVDRGVFVGSVKGNVKLDVKHSSINGYCGSALFAGLGTIEGERSDIIVAEAGIMINLVSDKSTCVGSYNGYSNIDVRYASFKLDNSGKAALAIGGVGKESDVIMVNDDIRFNIRSSFQRDTFADEERIEIINGRSNFMVNGYVKERKVVYKNI